jgi:hypothetical protein
LDNPYYTSLTIEVGTTTFADYAFVEDRLFVRGKVVVDEGATLAGGVLELSPSGQVEVRAGGILDMTCEPANHPQCP